MKLAQCICIDSSVVVASHTVMIIILPFQVKCMVFDAVLQRYRMRRKKKQGELSELSAEREEEVEKVIVEQT